MWTLLSPTFPASLVIRLVPYLGVRETLRFRFYTFPQADVRAPENITANQTERGECFLVYIQGR